MNDRLEGRISHYTIGAPLGAGGMGAVYHAHDDSLDRDVALKVLLDRDTHDPTARARLIREAQTASALNHPNIAHVYEVGEDGGRIFIAMELARGRTLQSAIPPGGLPAGEVERLGFQIADALAHAHEHGVIHRDLKSTNVMITPEGRVKVLDFGLAKRAAGSRPPGDSTLDLGLTEPGMVMGTPNHLSPEVLRGAEADARSDVWALGIVLYEMASGRLPFSGSSMADLAAAIVGGEPAPLSARVSSGLQMVIARCLAKDPARRYARASDVAAALEALQSGVRPSPLPGRGSRIAIALSGAAVVALIGVLAWFPGGMRDWFRGGEGHPTIRSLAVLPLTNLSGDSSQDYFADGMTEELITDLAPTPSLKVISRTSVIRFKNTRLSIPEIAKELGVDAIVEGSVLRVGDRVRVTAQLIHAASDRHLWARSFERDFREVLQLQSEVARDITSEIQLKLAPQVSAKLASKGLVNPEAYELDLKGRFEWNQATPASLDRSIEFFQQALALDPNDARALSGIADTYLLQTQVLGTVEPREGMALVQDYARRAIAADPGSAEAHATLATSLLFGDWNWREARREVDRALELNPGYGPAHLVDAVVHAAMGEVKEAVEANRRSLAVDPYSQLNQWHAIITLRASKRYDEAVALAKRALESRPDSPLIQEALLRVYEQQGRFEPAIDILVAMLREEPDGAVWTRKLREAYRARGPAGYWATGIAYVLQSGRPPGETATALAHLYAGAGDYAHAIEQLEKAQALHVSDLLFMKVEPFFDPMHDDPRFQAIVRKMGLP